MYPIAKLSQIPIAGITMEAASLALVLSSVAGKPVPYVFLLGVEPFNTNKDRQVSFPENSGTML